MRKEGSNGSQMTLVILRLCSWLSYFNEIVPLVCKVGTQAEGENWRLPENGCEVMVESGKEKGGGVNE